MEDDTSYLPFITLQQRILQTNNTSDNSLTSSTDSEIVRNTLRIYGTLYAVCMILYTFLRRRYPKLFNVRGWAHGNSSKLAASLQYSWCNWLWKVFSVEEHELMEECGMDAVCFLRALQFGRQLCALGILNALWLIPLYGTAPESSETDYLKDGLVKISIANVPSSSLRFLGTVISAYITFPYAMYLIFHEVKWFTCQRHLFLSRKQARNYAVYVSGIPEAYRSSHQLANYFRQCGANEHAVLEAHICRDTPKLDALVLKRTKLVAQLEHAVALEKRTGRTVQHTRILWRNTSLCCVCSSSNDNSAENSTNNIMERVDSVHSLESKLQSLNRSVQRRIGEISAQSSRRGGISRSMAKMDLLHAIQENGAVLSQCDDDDDVENCEPMSPSSSISHVDDDDDDCADEDDAFVVAEEEELGGLRRRLRTFSETLTAAVLPLNAALPKPSRIRTQSSGNDNTAVVQIISKPKTMRTRFTTVAGRGATTTTTSAKPDSIRHRSTTFAAALPDRSNSSSAQPQRPQHRRALSVSLAFASSSEPEHDFKDDLLARALASGTHLYSNTSEFNTKSPETLPDSCWTKRDKKKSTGDTDHHFFDPATDAVSYARTENEEAMIVEEMSRPSTAIRNQIDHVENAEPIGRLDPARERTDNVVDPLVVEPSSVSNNNQPLLQDFYQQWLQQGIRTTHESSPQENSNQRVLQQEITVTKEPIQLHQLPTTTDDYNECAFMDQWLAVQRQHESATNGTTIPERDPSAESQVDDNDVDEKMDNDLQHIEMIDGDVEVGVVVDAADPCPARALSEQSSTNSILSVSNANNGNNIKRRMHRSEDETMESTRSGWSALSSSNHSSGSRGGGSSSRGSSRYVVSDSIRRGTRAVGKAGTTLAQGSRAAGSTIAKGSQVVGSSIAKGSQAVGTSLAKGSQVVGTSAEWIVQNVGEKGGEALKKANKVGSHIVTSAGAVVPSLLLNKEEGKARDAGFVVFTNLYTVQTALQMIHHPKPYVMDVMPAPDPKQIFWRNVGLPSQSKRTGIMMALTMTTVFCFFWSIPMAFVSSLTEVNSLKESLPKLGRAIEETPWLEVVIAQVAPLLMLALNEGVLPVILKYFGTWEGHISSAMLEASLFTKMGCFMVREELFDFVNYVI